MSKFWRTATSSGCFWSFIMTSCIIMFQQKYSRSSSLQMFYVIGVLINFAKFTKKRSVPLVVLFFCEYFMFFLFLQNTSGWLLLKLTQYFFLEHFSQFVILKPLSYCFEEAIRFEVKVSFASRPVSHLIRWFNKPCNTTKEFWKRLFISMGLFIDCKLETVLFPWINTFCSITDVQCRNFLKFWYWCAE